MQTKPLQNWERPCEISILYHSIGIEQQLRAEHVEGKHGVDVKTQVNEAKHTLKMFLTCCNFTVLWMSRFFFFSLMNTHHDLPSDHSDIVGINKHCLIFL